MATAKQMGAIAAAAAGLSAQALFAQSGRSAQTPSPSTPSQSSTQRELAEADVDSQGRIAPYLNENKAEYFDMAHTFNQARADLQGRRTLPADPKWHGAFCDDAHAHTQALARQELEKYMKENGLKTIFNKEGKAFATLVEDDMGGHRIRFMKDAKRASYVDGDVKLGDLDPKFVQGLQNSPRGKLIAQLIGLDEKLIKSRAMDSQTFPNREAERQAKLKDLDTYADPLEKIKASLDNIYNKKSNSPDPGHAPQAEMNGARKSLAAANGNVRYNSSRDGYMVSLPGNTGQIH